jgi:hypothetical protein
MNRQRAQGRPTSGRRDLPFAALLRLLAARKKH